MVKTLAVAARDRARLAEILQVASRFGLNVLLARIGLARGDEADADPPGMPRRTRLALEALGPTFVKLGQILATRGDLLSPEWIAELEKLHSQAPTLPFDALRPSVEEALGQPPETAFATFDPVPLAAASMAQVHRATLHDGTDVVVKVQRPGIRPRMEADLRLIIAFAALAESASVEASRFAPAGMMRQLAASVLEELDFTNEGRNADRLRTDFADDDVVVVPRIHWAHSSPTLLVMDYISGVAPRSADDLRAAGIDPTAIAERGAGMVLDMVMVNGRFHGDPHPGNLLCLPGNRIALLDLGMIGHASPRRRQEFVGFMQALTNSDAALLSDILLTWSGRNDVPADRVRIAAERLIARHGGRALVLSALVADAMALMREDGLTMPPDLLLIFKALMTIDGVLTAIQPGFDLSAAMRGASSRIAAAYLSPERLAPALQAVGWELLKLGDDAPRLLRAAVRRLEAEPLTTPAPIDPMPAARLIATAVLTAATLVATAMLFG